MKLLINKLFIANDHAGLHLKKEIINYFKDINIIDLGCHSEDLVDYPDFARIISQSIEDDKDFGILICGSGIGMSIAANRFPHIRAAICHNTEYAKLAREHNNSNVLVLGARFLKIYDAIQIITTFLDTDFLGGRHTIRIKKL